jgi:hypothetical protein
LERALLKDIFRWTGHFPERTRFLLRQLAERAETLQQGYEPEREAEIVVALTTFLSSLAMNYVHHGSYFPALAKQTAPPKSS